MVLMLYYHVQVFLRRSISWVGLCLRVSIVTKLHDPVSIAAWMQRDPGSWEPRNTKCYSLDGNVQAVGGHRSMSVTG